MKLIDFPHLLCAHPGVSDALSPATPRHNRTAQPEVNEVVVESGASICMSSFLCKITDCVLENGELLVFLSSMCVDEQRC
jgi:hypothetical protein